MSSKKKQVAQSNLELRSTLEKDVEAFLKAGNKIEQVPSGVSGQPTAAQKKAAKDAAKT